MPTGDTAYRWRALPLSHDLPIHSARLHIKGLQWRSTTRTRSIGRSKPLLMSTIFTMNTRFLSPWAFTLLLANWLGLAFFAPTLWGGELTISTDFPGGSGDVVGIQTSTAKAAIRITPTLQPDRGWPCWWYVRINGAARGQAIEFTVHGNASPFRGSQRLGADWALPNRAAISADNRVWSQTDPATRSNSTATYLIVAPAETFWLAWGPPFVVAHGESLLNDVVAALTKQNERVERFELARSREDRSVGAIRFGQLEAEHSIWVQARQHAWESGSSWVGDGFIRWMSSSDPDAVQLRSQTEIVFVPIMDVDNVQRGAGGKDAAPRDHNRDWAARPVYPEVLAAQSALENRIRSQRLRLFIDLHNPAPNDLAPFFFGPLDYDQLPSKLRQKYDRFLQLAVEQMRGPLAIQPQYRFATYVPTAEEQSRVSRNWVGDRVAPSAISVTLETAWNTPASTIEGYQHVGRGLAQTVTRYLRYLSEARATTVQESQ